LAHDTLYVADTNNHLIRTVDLKTQRVGTLEINGLQPPRPPVEPAQPDFSRATQVAVGERQLKPVGGKIRLLVDIQLPAGWKMNPAAPMRYYVTSDGKGPVTESATGWREVSPPASQFTVELPVSGEGVGSLRLGMDYFYCSEDGSGLCKVGSVQFNVAVRVSERGRADRLLLEHVTR
jgi:hypothetical protein